MSYKSINGLVSYLNNNGIQINATSQKNLLRNVGYFHGYKGYRYFKDSSNRIPFTSFDEIYKTIQYDTDIKALFYRKLMYIETALKNIALEMILDKSRSESLQDMYDNVIAGYNNIKGTNQEKKKAQENKLNLQRKMQSNLAYAYKSNNKKIVHFYNNNKHKDIPIWALFEIIMLGDFGYLLSCLTYDTREVISKKIGLNLSCDTDRELVYKYVYVLKDLRNAIAHNDVIFDTRFRKTDITNAMSQCLILDLGLPFINFENIGDYVILIAYFLKLLKVPKKETKAFIDEFVSITEEYKKSVNENVVKKVIRPDLNNRMELLKKKV